MKEILIEYAKIIGYTVIGIVFGFSFFMLFLNLYHYKEVNYTFTKADINMGVTGEVKNTLKSISANTATFDANSYRGKEDLYSMASLKSRIDLCVNDINNIKAYKIFNKRVINIKDVYNLQQDYQIYVGNECLAKELYDLTNTSDTKVIKITSLNVMAPFFKDNLDQLLSSTNYIQSSIKNNSSYYFSSDTAKLNLFDFTRDSYFEVVANYKKAVNFVYDVSTWYAKVVRGEL